VKTLYQKRFLKELAHIPSPVREEIEQFVFHELPITSSPFQDGRIEQLHGYPHYFKIRFGNYRVGLKIEHDSILLMKVLHRKDIYRYFP
jgi:mRNA interferase RelE/StbE